MIYDSIIVPIAIFELRNSLNNLLGLDNSSKASTTTFDWAPSCPRAVSRVEYTLLPCGKDHAKYKLQEYLHSNSSIVVSYY